MERAEPDSPMEIDDNELWILSYYRASELAGALVMGRLARETDDDDLRVRLTEHCAEEANHAWQWTRTILEVGGTPRRVAETYQSRYYAEIGPPRTVLEVLALTQVFEKRVLRHFRDHLRRPGTHPAVARTLEGMIADEVGHVGWVRERLNRHAREQGDATVAEVLRRFTEVDRRVYGELLEYRDRFAALVDPARSNGSSIERSSANGSSPPSGASVDESERTGADVERAILRVVSRSLGRRPEDLDATASLRELGVDSLDLVVAVGALEEEFRIELTPDDTDGLRTLGELIGKVTELANRTSLRAGAPSARGPASAPRS